MDINEIVNEMTLEEKAKLVNGSTFFGMAAIERLGIKRLQLLDGGTGMNFEQLFGDYYSQIEEETNSTNGMMGSTILTHVIENYYYPDRLDEEEKEVYRWIKERLERQTGGDYAPGCFPPGILLGATFQKQVVREVGESLGAEARLFGVDILLGTPNVNIHRDPLNGRLFEGYSEDPCLVAELAPEMVKGVQNFGIAANVKHFAANNQETNRVGINETISERALKEIYLPGFRACVEKGQVKTVMSAYNAINGVPCTENSWLLTEELRNNWGFDGMVVSDWGAVYHPVEALEAGNDLAMPGPIDGTPIVEAVKSGRLKEDVLNLAVKRILKLIDDCKPAEGKEHKIYNREQLFFATTKAAYDAAVEGIVLLKNRENLFPLKKENHVFLVGSAANQLLECGSGSAGITTNRTSSLSESLREFLGADNVWMPENCGYDWEFQDMEPNQKRLLEKETTCILAVVKVGGMEGNDRENLALDKQDVMLLQKMGKWKEQYAFRLGLVLNVCGPVDTTPYEAFTDGIFVCFLPGMEGGHALSDLMTGKRTPSGKLPLTFPKKYEDTPTCLNFPGDGYEVHYGEGIYVGYRYYDKKKILPAYSFGFGLSYTTFEVEELVVDTDVFTEKLQVEVTITNTGTIPGAEVLQLYISDPYSTLPKPVKELKAFEKVYLQAGETKAVSFTLKKEQFASYDTDYHMWIAEEGYYDILIATSSREKDIRQRKRVYLENQTPYSYGMTSTIKVFYEEEALKERLKDLWMSKHWDWQIIESNYQYTPNRKLVEVLPEPWKQEDVDFASFQKFIENVKKR